MEWTESDFIRQGEDWEEGFASGLLNSLCFFPVLTYGSTAPLAELAEDTLAESVAAGWEERPLGRQRLRGSDLDPEDNVLKEFVIAVALLERRSARNSEAPRQQDADANEGDGTRLQVRLA